MKAETVLALAHLLGALAAGGLIGLERSFHGRAAGFRTHALVCMASSLLMLVTLFQAQWFPAESHESVRVDPTRMAQGIMTGIGFLGAGVIFRDGLSVRGLTTAASIWITAAIGILIGVGIYAAAVAATLLAIVVLAMFRYIERVMPKFYYAAFTVQFQRDAVMAENELRRLLVRHQFRIGRVTYHLNEGGQTFEYHMLIHSLRRGGIRDLAEALGGLETIKGFSLVPSDD